MKTCACLMPLLALSFATAADAAEPSPSPVLYASAGVGAVLSGPHTPAPSFEGTFRATLPFGHYVALEALLTAGYADVSGAPNDGWARMALGVRVERDHRTFSPYGAFRLVHIHFAPAEVWWEHPGASLAGDSADGLQHSSGMALAGGVTWAFPRTSMHLRGMAEVEASWIPIGNAPEWFAVGVVGIGYAF